MSASSAVSAPERSRVALEVRLVGVSSAALRRALASLASLASIACLLPIGWIAAARTRPIVASALDEGEQVLVHLVLQRRAQAVRRTLVDFEHCALDDLGGQTPTMPISPTPLMHRQARARIGCAAPSRVQNAVGVQI